MIAASLACLSLTLATASFAEEPMAPVAGVSRASLDKLIDSAWWGAQWATVSTCNRASREREINDLHHRLAKIMDAYQSRFGEEADYNFLIIEGNGCIRGYKQQSAYARQNIEKAEAMLGLVP